MKICLISDSHGNIDVIKRIAVINYKCDRFIDCGDSELYVEDISPFASVKGNCDYLSNFPEHIMFEADNHRFLISHKKQTLDYLAKNNIDIHFYGHTHIKEKYNESGIIFVNPGSCSRPRDGINKSYAIITTENNCVDVVFKKIE